MQQAVFFHQPMLGQKTELRQIVMVGLVQHATESFDLFLLFPFRRGQLHLET